MQFICILWLLFPIVLFELICILAGVNVFINAWMHLNIWKIFVIFHKVTNYCFGLSFYVVKYVVLIFLKVHILHYHYILL